VFAERHSIASIIKPHSKTINWNKREQKPTAQSHTEFKHESAVGTFNE
jgi:hypothetical protein